MKKTFLSFTFLVLTTLFYSCSTKVDLYADYKDIPVIYGLLDATQDTNFIRINRAFSGSNDNPINANEIALIADSCNYPGKLDARIYRYSKAPSSFSDYVVEDFLVLDTMTIHDKQEGVFYSPSQKVYYSVTNQSNQNWAFFKTNTSNKNYKYKLVVLKGNDTISSETGLVGGENFDIMINQIFFTSMETDKQENVFFRLADNAVVYDVMMQFNYQEKRGSQLIDKEVHWSLGTKSKDEMTYDDVTGYPYFSCSRNALFNYLSSAIGNDTINVERYIGDFVIYLSAGGDELYNYIQVNSPSEGFSQTIPDYTNIKGGYGVFSSRIHINKIVKLMGNTERELYNKPWGFKQQ